MDKRTTGLIAAVLAGVGTCFCGGIFLLMGTLFTGLSLPFLGAGLLTRETADATVLPSPTPTPNPGRATAVLGAPQSTPSPYEIYYEEAEAIERQVQLLRGLEPVFPISCSFVTMEDFQMLLEQTPPALSLTEVDEVTFQALGLYDTETAGSLDEEVAVDVLLAAYDEQEPGRCTVLFQEDQTGWQADYARSYARTLIRQHYLDITETECTLFLPEYDTCLAERALLEGDVFLLTRQWQRQFGLPEWTEPVLIEHGQPDTFLSNMASFPFLYGYNYVQQTYLEEGWAGVDQLYSDPANTTQQILHPDARISQDPEQLEPLEDISAELGDGWKLVNQGALGEWLIHLFLDTAPTDEDTLETAGGWETDRFQVYQNSSSGETILIWAAQWKNVPAVYTARRTIREFAKQLFADVDIVSQDEFVVESSPAVWIERENLQTLMILSPGQDLMNLARGELSLPLRSQ